jgi:hypothetical protein
MSGTFPTSPEPADIKVSSFTPTLVSQTQSLKRQVRRRGGHRWAFDVNFPPMNRSEFAPVYAFCIAQRGQFETFTFVPPVVSDPQGTATGTPLVNGAQSAGDNTIVTDGWSNSITCLKAGDFVKFAGHNKVYMVTADATSDGSGNSTLTIEPPLLADVADDESITVADVPFTVALVSDMQEFAAGPPNLYEFSLQLIEVI